MGLAALILGGGASIKIKQINSDRVYLPVSELIFDTSSALTKAELSTLEEVSKKMPGEKPGIFCFILIG